MRHFYCRYLAHLKARPIIKKMAQAVKVCARILKESCGRRLVNVWVKVRPIALFNL